MADSAILGYFPVPMSTGRRRHLALRLPRRTGVNEKLKPGEKYVEDVRRNVCCNDHVGWAGAGADQRHVISHACAFPDLRRGAGQGNLRMPRVGRPCAAAALSRRAVLSYVRRGVPAVEPLRPKRAAHSRLASFRPGIMYKSGTATSLRFAVSFCVRMQPQGGMFESGPAVTSAPCWAWRARAPSAVMENLSAEARSNVYRVSARRPWCRRAADD